MRWCSSPVLAAAAAICVATASAGVPKVYRDPVGDAERGHGDIASVQVSDSRGVVTMRIDVLSLRASDEVIVQLATRVMTDTDYALDFSKDGSWGIDHVNVGGQVTSLSPSSTLTFSPNGHVYTFRFGPSVLKGTSRFAFNVHVDTAVMADVSDWAPRELSPKSPNDWWKYALTSIRH